MAVSLADEDPLLAARAGRRRARGSPALTSGPRSAGRPGLITASDVTFLHNSPQGPALDLYMATAPVGGLHFRGIEDWRLATVPAELLPPEGTIYARDNE